MDERRLVIPKALGPIIIEQRATVATAWWPRLQREVVGIAETFQEFKIAWKNNQPKLRQNQLGQLQKGTDTNQEMALDYAVPFCQNAKTDFAKLHMI